MRAIAALMVVLFHILTNMYGSDRAATDPHIYIFSGGVDLFFVISGFVMFHITTGRSINAWAFMQARLMRIAPLYWLTTAFMLALGLLAAKPLPPLSDIACSLAFISCTMADGSTQPLFNPGWTLNYEMFFYSAFACALFIRDWRWRVAVVTAFLLVLVGLKPVLGSFGAAGLVYASGIVLEFVMGIGVGMVYRRFGRQLPAPKIFIGVGLLLGIGLMESTSFKGSRMLYAALPAALILTGLLALDVELPKLPLLAVIGDASYSIYLSHPMVLDLVDYWLPFTGKPSVAVAAAAATASICAGIAVYFGIERPLKLKLHRKASSAKPLAATAGA
jgi:exopolysaccharide production protein ExoZ